MDSVVTDPPYHLASIVKRFGAVDAAPAKFGKDGAYQRASTGFMGKVWDGGDVAFQPDTWKGVLRVLKPGGHLVAFGHPKNVHRLTCAIEDAGFEIRDTVMWIYGSGFPKSHNVGKTLVDWEGWGTALKPAHEPIVIARKPLVGTVAENVFAFGTGALNIDDCRIDGPGGVAREGEESQERRYTDRGSTNFAALPGPRGGDPAGRWPANVIHDGSEEVLDLFPETAGSGKGGVVEYSQPNIRGDSFNRAKGRQKRAGMSYAGGGSTARFFYCPKADAEDRAGSKHPTVKPIALLRYLCRLVTPPGGTVLDPFAGTGTTGEAAFYEGFKAILIEREQEYIADIELRMQLALAGPEERKRLLAKPKELPPQGLPLFVALE